MRLKSGKFRLAETLCPVCRILSRDSRIFQVLYCNIADFTGIAVLQHCGLSMYWTAMLRIFQILYCNISDFEGIVLQYLD